MNTNTWIKRSEREPTEADLPIVMGGFMCGSGKTWDVSLHQCLPASSHWGVYWRSIKCDPPARELTQRERDDEAVRDALVRDYTCYQSPEGRERIGKTDLRHGLQLIYAERREVAKLIRKAFVSFDDWGIGEDWADATVQLRARLDEQGQGK